jgi:WD40 repeat protein/uncharacterized caspase-like protein/energy-coupling factor transporter ATP-binding protein EcfA2
MPRTITRSTTTALETGQAKLWILLIGVNVYQDKQLPDLQYPAIDCQGLADALIDATQELPQKTVKAHHDFSSEAPTLLGVRQSLKEIIASAQPQDTVLFYFSGHGVIEASTQQAVLCLSDTEKSNLLETGLSMAELLRQLNNCAAKQQIVCLDACHSGGMTLRGAWGADPTPELMEVLQRQATQTQGFYAILSCDQNQQSWEFPELGHGVFTYFLMQGLRGEAADAQGVIEADGLYKYVYYQTLRYIDQTNQQLRLMNQQKRGRGETQLQPEYPLQTPKRIVEGVGELVLGVRSHPIETLHPRQAIVVETLPNPMRSLELSKILRQSGGFNLEFHSKDWASIRDTIQTHLCTAGTSTVLLYLHGKIEEVDGEAWFILGDGERIARSWLRQALRRSTAAHQIVILDCPGATRLADWVEDLQLGSDLGQCIIAAAPPRKMPEQFTQALLATLQVSDKKVGLPIAGWITQLQTSLAGQFPLHIWLSGTQGVIEVLPGQIAPRKSENLDLGICPYMGLQAFTEADAQYFHGRESLTQKLLQEVQRNACLAVVGASGSGKSSVVQAGLMAQLRQGKQIPDSDRWWIARMRPGERPLTALAKRLADAGTNQQAQIEGLLHQGAEGFVQWVRSRPEPMILLVIDQFEELFTLSPAEDRSRFLELILESLKYASDRFKLVFTLRADFIAACLENPELADIVQNSSIFVSPTLSDEDYRQVILRPAEQVGLIVKPGLVEVLLQQLNRRSGNLPLLEFVLEQLWQYREMGALTLRAFQHQVGGLQGALERKAQAVYDNFNPNAQECARWIFLSLTQLGDGNEDTRRKIFRSDLAVSKFTPELIDRTLQALADAKLIVVDVDEALVGQGKGLVVTHASSESLPVSIEIAHEILIQHWSTLRWWLDENRQRLRSQRQFQQAAAEWQRHDRHDDFLIRGIRLVEAEELYTKYTDEIPALTQQFIEASLEQRHKEQKEIQKRLKQAQRVAVVIGALGISATGFAGFAMWKQRDAQVREVEALSASSEALLSTNRQLEALKTGIKAGRRLQQVDQPWNFVPADVRMNAIATLQQAIAQTHEINRLEGHSREVNDAIFSPDGKLIATASSDGLVKLWQSNGKLLRDLNGHQNRVTAIAFRSDGKAIATASADKTVKIWNLDGKALLTLSGHKDWVTDVRFHPNGQWIASASRDGTIRLWRSNGQLVQTFRGHRGWVNRLSFSPDGKGLVSGGEDGTVKFWQVNAKPSPNPVRSFVADKERVTSVAVSPDGKLLATSGKTARLWTLSGKAIAALNGHSDQVSAIAFSPDSKTVVTASADGTIRRWNMKGATLQLIKANSSEIYQTRFSPQGERLLSASADKTARLWRVENEPQPLSNTTFASTASPDGKTFAVANANRTIQVLRGGKILRTFKGHTGAIVQLAFSPDGLFLASSSEDKTIKLWNLETGVLVKTLLGHQSRVTTILFRPDGGILASGSADKTIKLWAMPSGELVETLKGHTDEIATLGFSLDGKLLVSGGFDSTIRVWTAESPQSILLGRHKLAISSLAFTPDGKTLASASWDNTIQIWNVQDATPEKAATAQKTLLGHSDGINSLSFNSDGQVLASGSADRTIKFWDVQTGTLVKTLAGHQSAVKSATFSADGRELVSVSDRTGLVLLDLHLENLLKQACLRIANQSQSHSEDQSLCPKK